MKTVFKVGMDVWDKTTRQRESNRDFKGYKV